MGHIVNTKSIRLGWTTIWADSWYTEFIYYSEFLHLIFRLRFYLIYIFTRRHFDKKAIFYSHFELYKYYKNIYIEIYYYSGKLESNYEDFKFDFFFKIYNYDFNKDPETKKAKFLFLPMKLLVIWNWALNFKLENVSFKILSLLSRIIRKYKLNYIKRITKNIKIKGLQIKIPMFFYFFPLLSIYIKIKLFIKSSSVFRPKKNTIFKRMYMLTGCYKKMYSYIFFFGSILSYIFLKLSKGLKIYIEFFLTNNNCINAKFLSRFIARKLKQNYPVKELINPIRKDLLYVMKLSIIPRKAYNSLINKTDYYLFKNKVIGKFLYKNLLKIIFSAYKLFYNKFFKITKTFFTLDLFLLNILLTKKLIHNYELIKIVTMYFKRKCAYICFFENNIKSNLEFKTTNKNNNKLFLPYSFNLNLLSNKNKFKNLFLFIFDNFYISFLSIINYYYYTDIFFFNFKFIRYSCLNFNRYLKFNYWINQINLDSNLNIWKLNNLKSRITNHTKANNLKGYKMYLSGRFKRKQRAASYWISKGKTPLNTLNAFVDYAFYTIPLRNSAITVKIWLYKSSNLSNLYYIKIY